MIQIRTYFNNQSDVGNLILTIYLFNAVSFIELTEGIE